MPCIREWDCVECTSHQCYLVTLLNSTRVCMYDDAPIYTWVVTTDKKIEDCDYVPNPWMVPTIFSGIAGGLALIAAFAFMIVFWIRSRRREVELSEVRRLLNRRDEEEEGRGSVAEPAVAGHSGARLALGTGAGAIYDVPKKGDIRLAKIVRTMTETEF